MVVTGKKVLIIDDNEDLVELMRIHLESVRFVVETAGSIREAESKLSADVDVVVLDLLLGEEDNGMEVLEYVRASDELKEVPVLILSRKTEDKQQALDKGADYFMEKPYESDELISKLIFLCDR